MKTPKFAVTSLDDIQIGDEPVWMIEGLLPATGFGVVFGPPKSGKSFLVTDALFHVALGQPWAGCNVRQGTVVYITGEGVSGFKRRMVALRRHHEVEGQNIPFGMIEVPPDFGHTNEDAQELIEMIRSWLADHGYPPLAAICIDTLARAMKGADENTAKDMTTFVDNCAVVGDAFGCLVLAVHHAGKDVARGSRGSNALDGAVDVMWSVEKGEAVSTASIHHMKDGPEGLSWQFRLDAMTLNEATETKPAITTCVVEIVTDPALTVGRPARKPPLGDKPRLLLTIVREAVSEAGEFHKGDINVPYQIKSVSRDRLKRYLRIRAYWDDERTDGSNRASLSNNLTTLQSRGYIGQTKDRLWLVDP